MHKKARASALAFVSLCKKVKIFSTKVKKPCYKEGVKTKGVDIMTVEQKFMEVMKQSFKENQREEYAKKVEELTKKWRNTMEMLLVAEDRYNQAGKEMSQKEIAEGKLDVYIKSVRNVLAKLYKLKTQIDIYKELAESDEQKSKRL